MTERDDSGSWRVPAYHSHTSPETGMVSRPASWPCPQCIALGRTGPLTYASDGGTVADSGGVDLAEVPPDRLDAYLASFPAPAEPDPGPPGGHRARRSARRKAERQARRRNR